MDKLNSISKFCEMAFEYVDEKNADVIPSFDSKKRIEMEFNAACACVKNAKAQFLFVINEEGLTEQVCEVGKGDYNSIIKDFSADRVKRFWGYRQRDYALPFVKNSYYVVIKLDGFSSPNLTYWAALEFDKYELIAQRLNNNVENEKE